MQSNKKALVLLSGGQDSTTCLFWAKEHFADITCLNIRYGQRHLREIAAARKIAHLIDVPCKEFNTTIFQDIGDSALVGKGDISASHKSTSDLPASFVPGRNIIFLTIAAMYAYKNNIQDIVTGVCQTDYSGYPDCRENTIRNLQTTLSLGMDTSFKIHIPLMHLTKAASVNLAKTLPGCMEALAYSHTCYEGKIPPCGKCPACLLRAKGFAEAGIIDPLFERRQF